ncbi:hypothetical protein MRB53_003777 [Persea americana]|uniref:Uncharacterized protein n=1 Tax=Persea americana TaxID=3435 RepID=A0ACC2MYL8_PERAE|nr:hypothetical protein MRB53_003777 [Persea americana]
MEGGEEEEPGEMARRQRFNGESSRKEREAGKCFLGINSRGILRRCSKGGIEEDGVSEGRVHCETRALEHLTLENELEHVGVGSVPAVGPIECPGAQAVVCDVRAGINRSSWDSQSSGPPDQR